MPRDLDCGTVEELVREMDQARAKGYTVFVKWTCPACGERCMSDMPNAFQTEGYEHTEKRDGTPCGAVYHGERFGFGALLHVGPSPADAAERN